MGRCVTGVKGVEQEKREKGFWKICFAAISGPRGSFVGFWWPFALVFFFSPSR